MPSESAYSENFMNNLIVYFYMYGGHYTFFDGKIHVKVKCDSKFKMPWPRSSAGGHLWNAIAE
jgi:hypothetical protein